MTGEGTCDCGRGPNRGVTCEDPGCLGDFGVDCSSRGTCSPDGNGTLACICQDNWNGDGCETMTCRDDCNAQGTCTSYNYTTVNDDGETIVVWVTPYCECDARFFGEFCQYECMNGVVEADEDTGATSCTCEPCYTGVRCDVECSNHGNCSDDALSCECGDDGWRGDHCEIDGCPGLTSAGDECSAHGSCQSSYNETTDVLTFSCLCQQGWNGTRCDVAQCTDDCNNRGDCMSNAVVPYCDNCDDGWYGDACEVQCFGTVTGSISEGKAQTGFSTSS